MPLTRLDNLISSKTGKYLYVSPDDFNATDALSNRGNSPVTPFKSIQRAFLEIARYSYLPGFGNDRFDQFSIMLMPGIHYIDNRPGLADTSNIDVFGRRRPRDIDTLQDEVIDQMMEMDSIEGFAHGGSIPQTPMMPQGMQLDGRGGGFIPMGAQEKKDDVPAMLAKNEFVMTSDAVRAAGGGDINKGAQKMYDLMNSLESKV